MNNLLNLTSVEFSVAGKLLFKNVNLNLIQGTVVALIGQNGSGKSSLLKLISGVEKSNAGEVFYSKTNLKIGYLAQQDTQQRQDVSIYDYLVSLNLEFWEITALAENIFGLKIEDYLRPISTLSGGEMMQLNLANIFLANSDLLLLDEPTNHLDILSLNKLKNYIQSSSKTFVIVSHNNYFIENVANHIWAIKNNKIETFAGKLSQYEEYKNLQIEKNAEMYRVERSNLKKLEEASKREKEKSEKGKNSIRKKYLEGSYDASQYGYFKNIGSKSSSKLNAKFENLKTQTKTKIASLKSYDQPILLPNLSTDTGQSKRKLLKMENSNLYFEQTIIVNNLTLDLSYGQRIAIVGRNGSGKTCLVKSIYQGSISRKDLDQQPTQENLEKVYLSNFTLFDNVKIAYLNQRYEIINREITVLENIIQYSQIFNQIQARHHLSNFKFFTLHDVSKLAKNLSGGELSRLALAMITSRSIDLLILDEPTNNLDIFVVNQMVQALQNFKAAIILVSHDLSYIRQMGIEEVLFLQKKIACLVSINQLETNLSN